MQKAEQKAKAEGAVEAINNILNSLCKSELTHEGRDYVRTLKAEYQNDIDRIENEAE